MIARRRLPALKAAATLVAVALGSACASGDSARGAGLPADCIINRGVDDFDALDDTNLIVYGTGGRPYHVVLASLSISIESEIAIGIYDTDGRICPYGGDMIIVEGVLREMIPIRSIEEIDDEQVEALRVRFGELEPAGDAVTVTEAE